MDEKLKQRVIGILVLVGALFIILPFLFHNAHPSAAEKPMTPGSVSSSTVSVAWPAEQTVTSTTSTAPSTASTASTAPSTTLAVPSTPTTALTATSSGTATPQVNSSAQPIQNAAVSKQSGVVASSSTQKKIKTDSQNINSNTIADTANAAGFKPDQAVSPASGLTQGAPISAAPAEIKKMTSASPFDYQSLNHNRSTAAESAQTPSAHKQVHSASYPAHHAKHKIAHASKHTTKNGKWEVQVAVFEDSHNAKTLLTKLHAHHIPAYTQSVSHHGKHMTVVLAGPEKTHQRAVMMQNRLRQLYHLNGMVRMV